MVASFIILLLGPTLVFMASVLVVSLYESRRQHDD